MRYALRLVIGLVSLLTGLRLIRLVIGLVSLLTGLRLIGISPVSSIPLVDTAVALVAMVLVLVGIALMAKR